VELQIAYIERFGDYKKLGHITQASKMFVSLPITVLFLNEIS
jgi:hypothetical protein